MFKFPGTDCIFTLLDGPGKGAGTSQGPPAGPQHPPLPLEKRDTTATTSSFCGCALRVIVAGVAVGNAGAGRGVPRIGGASLSFCGVKSAFRACSHKSAFCKRSHAIWQRRTNVWRKTTRPAEGLKRLRGVRTSRDCGKQSSREKPCGPSSPPPCWHSASRRASNDSSFPYLK